MTIASKEKILNTRNVNRFVKRFNAAWLVFETNSLIYQRNSFLFSFAT